MDHLSLRRNRAPRSIHLAVSGNVKEYHAHTNAVQRFIQDHGIVLNGWQSWDLAPFNVLNKRNGQPIPHVILDHLNAAIRGRSDVSDKFTEGNLDPRIQYDGSDVSHRVFIERLRTIRRVWFPEATRDGTPTADQLGLGAITVPKSDKGRKLALNGNPFKTVVGDQAEPFQKITFDRPVELLISAGKEKRKFRITQGEVILTPHTAASDSNGGPGPRTQPENVEHNVSGTTTTLVRTERKTSAGSMKQTLRSVTKWVCPKLIKRKRSGAEDKGPPTKSRPEQQAAKRRKVGDIDPDYIEISSDGEESDDDASVCVSFTPGNLSETDTASVERPIRRSARNNQAWTVEISVIGECMTFWNPAGDSPCTYIDEDDGKERLRRLLGAGMSLVAVTVWNGQKRELSKAALRAFATYDGNSFSDVLPQFLGGS